MTDSVIRSRRWQSDTTRDTPPNPQSHDLPSPRPAGFAARWYVEIVTFFALLFVIQTGLVPFDFSGNGAGRPFFSRANHSLALPDFVSNVVLYVPIGFLVHATLRRWTGGGLFPLAATIAVLATLSAVIECLQAYAPERVSSFSDLAANVVGAAIGAWLSVVGRGFLRRVMAQTLVEAHHRPALLALKVYVTLLAVYAVIPFSFAFDTMRMKRSLQSATLAPFRCLEEDRTLITRAAANGNVREAERIQRHSLSRWTGWVAEAASFIALAWLLRLVLRVEYGFGFSAAGLLAMYLGAALAVCLSLAQLFVLSRGFDGTDILFRALGLALGLVWRPWPQRDQDDSDLDRDARRLTRIAAVGAALCACIIVYNGLIPFSFRGDAHVPADALSYRSIVPLFAQSMSRFDRMILDSVGRMTWFAVFGALLAAKGSLRTGWGTTPPMRGIVMSCVPLAVGMELAQYFLAVRVPSVSGVVLAIAGSAAGVFVFRRIVAFTLVATFRHEAVPATAETRRPAPSLAAIDVLLASLADPHPAAPAEPSPKPAPKPLE